MNSTPVPRLTVAAAALATSLVFTLSAFAATRPDDRAGVRGPGPSTATRVVDAQPGLSARPDNRAGVLGVGTADKAVSVGTSTGFDWAAAGIDAGATAGLLMLLGVVVLIAIRMRHDRSVTAPCSRSTTPFDCGSLGSRKRQPTPSSPQKPA
jgi:hypothetical protein